MMTERRWHATIEVFERDAQIHGVAVPATDSDGDLQAAQAKSAIREAAEYIRTGMATHCYVQLTKTTRQGTRNDQSFQVYRDDHTGQIKAQR